MLAKAVANHTTAAFIRVVGSEFVQKYLGEVSLEFPISFVTSFTCSFSNFLYNRKFKLLHELSLQSWLFVGNWPLILFELCSLSQFQYC